MFNELKFFKSPLQTWNYLVAVALNVLPAHQLIDLNLVILLQLAIESVTLSTGADLVFQILVSQLSHHSYEPCTINWVLCNSRSLLELCNFCLIRWANLDFDLEAQTIFVFNMLTGSKTAELTIYHDAHFCAECFSLLHRVCCQNNHALFAQRGNVWDHSPHISLRLRVNTRARFIQEHNRWVSDKSDCALKLALIATREISCIYMLEVRQVHLFYLLFDQLGFVISAHTLYTGVKL